MRFKVVPLKQIMVAKEIIQTETSGNLAKQREFDVDKIIADSSGPCMEDQDGVFDMDDLGEAKGDKKPVTDQESSVRIIYSSLPRSSKRKLYELLNCWSNWHAQNCSSEKDSAEPIDDGEETFFPAIHVGLDKSSTMSFFIDNQARKRPRTESLSVDDSSAPLYNRNYSLGLTSDGGPTDENCPLDLRGAARCFNCGSYSHSLKECSKPYNNATVSNARKEYQSKKNKNPGPRLPTRYYQNSPAGKYDGLIPGCLAAETRELLGLKDLEPPPWLNRMLQLGYPPGYLDSEEENQPSGIMIFGDEEANNDSVNEPKSNFKGPQKKMTVDFPGINAPIPVNADPKAWEKVQGLPGSEFPGLQIDKLISHFPAPANNLHFPDRRWPQSYVNSPPLRHSYKSPCLHYSYESPPLNFNRPSYHHSFDPRHSSEPFSPRGIPIPRSPVPPGYITPQFSSGSPSFPGDRLFPSHNNPLPGSLMHQNLWHSPA